MISPLRRAVYLALFFSLLAAPRSMVRITGTWIWQGGQDSDFQLTLQEKGAKLSGRITGTMFKGNRVSTGVVSGTRTGDSAALTWRFTDGDLPGPEAGTASLANITVRSMDWKLEYKGKDDCWFPRGAILKRKVRLVKVAH